MIERVSIPLQQIDPDLPVPAYAYVGDAGVDLRATCDDILKPFERKLVPCGIAVAIPSGYAGFVLPRSGLAIKHGVSLVNAPGLIDSNYRGEIQAILVNLDPQSDQAGRPHSAAPRHARARCRVRRVRGAAGYGARRGRVRQQRRESLNLILPPT